MQEMEKTSRQQELTEAPVCSKFPTASEIKDLVRRDNCDH